MNNNNYYYFPVTFNPPPPQSFPAQGGFPYPPPPPYPCNYDPFWGLAEHCFAAFNAGVQQASIMLRELPPQVPPVDCSAHIVLGLNCLEVINERRQKHLLLGSIPQHVYVLRFDPLFNHEPLFSIEFHNHPRIILREGQWTPRDICEALSWAGLTVGSTLSRAKVGLNILNYLNGLRREFFLPFFAGWECGEPATYTPILRAREPGDLGGQVAPSWFAEQVSPSKKNSALCDRRGDLRVLLQHYRDQLPDPAVRLFFWVYFHYGSCITRLRCEGLSLCKAPLLHTGNAAGIRTLFDGVHAADYSIPELSMPADQLTETIFCAKDEVLLLADTASELGDLQKNLDFLERLVRGGTYPRRCRENYGVYMRQMPLQSAPLLCSERALHLTAPSVFFVLPEEDIQIAPLSSSIRREYANNFNRFLALHPELIASSKELPGWLLSTCSDLETQEFFQTLYAVWRLSVSYLQLHNIAIADYFGGEEVVKSSFLQLAELGQQGEPVLGLSYLFMDVLKELLSDGKLIPIEIRRRTPLPSYIVRPEDHPLVFRRRPNGPLFLTRAAVETIVQTIAPDLLPIHVLHNLREEGLLGPSTNRGTYYTKLQVYLHRQANPVRIPVLPLNLPEPLFGPGEPDPFKKNAGE